MNPIRVLVITALVAGCQKPATTAPSAEAPGMVAVEWAGVVRGKLVAVAAGTWCQADSLLEISAIRGDSGFGIALIEPDSVRPGQHPVVAPSVPVPWRPMALAALRWVTDTAVKGFEANSGNVVITAVVNREVSGTINVRLKQTDTNDTVRLTGRFTKVPWTSAVGSCGRANRNRATP